jgi:hypothetical protein
VTVKKAPQRAPSPRESVNVGRRSPGTHHGVKPVGSFLPGLTAKAFQKFGFSTASLVTDWTAIAGKELAACTVPERLKWPRSSGEGSEDAEPVRRQGATLVLRVDAARALDIQYQAHQVLERINAYFGYAAVAELRLIQAPVINPLPAVPARRSWAGIAPPTPEVAGIADPALRQALGRLAAGVRAAR